SQSQSQKSQSVRDHSKPNQNGSKKSNEPDDVKQSDADNDTNQQNVLFNNDTLSKSFVQVKPSSAVFSSDNSNLSIGFPEPRAKTNSEQWHELDKDLQYLDDQNNHDMTKVSLVEFTKSRYLQMDNKRLAQWIREKQYLLDKRNKLGKFGLSV
ncbi:hypothetical protein RFI_03833, partial [Reticulomyxa filosa]